MSNKHHIERADLAGMAEVARVSSYVEGVEVWTELAVYWREHETRPWVGVVEGRTNAADRTDRFKAMAAGTMDRVANWFEGSRLRDQLLSGVEQHLTIDGKVSTTIRDEAHQRARYASTLDEYVAAARYVNVSGVPLMVPGEEIKLGRIDPAKEEQAGRAIAASLGERYTPPPFATFSTATPKLRIVGITTDRLREALDWLYPETVTVGGLSVALERDFGMPARTVRRAISIEADASGEAGEQGAWVRMFLNAMKCFDRELWAAGQATIANVEG